MSADGEAVQRAERRLGSVLRGKYRLDRVLGVGGMAVVYAATHRNQKQFAVKVLHPELSLNADVRGRFLREGYAANSVKHPGALAVLDDDTAEDGSAFLVMELLEGASLEELWEQSQSKLPLAPVLGVAHQALDVLAAAHGKGIVHRDVKPANLFLTYDGVVKVLDFGIARVRDAAASGVQATGAGILLGTPAFMAPEQALGRVNEMDARTDLWALGATLFTLLTGRLVHAGETGPEVLIRAATSAAPSLGSVTPGIPAPVVAVIDRALAYSKEQRWPSAEAMRDAVVQAQIAVFGQRVAVETLSSLCRGLGRTFALTRARVAAAAAMAAEGSGPLPPAGTPLPVAAPWGAAAAQGGGVAPTVDAYGRPPVAATQPDPAVVAHAAPDPPTGGVPGVPPTVDGGDLEPPAASILGGTTARPVFTEEPLAPAGLPDRRPVWIGLAFAGAAVVAGAVAFGIHSMTTDGAQGSASAAAGPGASGVAGGLPLDAAALWSTARSSSVAPPAAPANSAPGSLPAPPRAVAASPPEGQPRRPVEPASPWQPSPISAAAAAAAPAMPAAPPRAASLPPAAPLPPAGPGGPSPGAGGFAAAPGAPAAAPNCKPPFFFDSAGNKVFKKECL